MATMCSTFLNRAFLVLVFWLIALSGRGQGQELEGQVLDGLSNKPLAGVQVTVHETEGRCLSDSNGHFKIVLKVGHYHLHFEKEAYIAQDLNLDFPPQNHLTITLFPSNIELEELLIEDEIFNLPSRNYSQELISIRTKDREQASQVDLGSILEKQAGLNALNTGVGISKPIIRGFSGNRVAVIDQGIKQEGQQWGMDHGLEIDPFQVQRMELVKGPAALQYGSDAIAGAVRILPEVLPKEKWSAQIKSNYHSNNQAIGLSASGAYRKGPLAVGLRLSRRQFQDFRVPADEFVYNGFVLPITDQRLKNTAGELQSAQAYLSWNTDAYRARYRLSVYDQRQGMYPGATGVPRAYDVGDIGDLNNIDLPLQGIQHYKFYSIQNIKLGKHWLETELGYQFNDREERSLPHAHGFNELDSNASLALGLKLHSLQLNSRYRLHWRAMDIILGTAQQYQRNYSRGFEYLIPDYGAYQSGLYLLANGQWHDQLFWDGGIRWEYKHQSSPQVRRPWWSNPDSLAIRSTAVARSFSKLAAAYGLVFLPSDQWQIKTHLARSFRAPNVAELSSNGVHHGTFRHERGNPELDPEIAWQIDLGLEYRQKDFLWRLSPFYYYFQNFIFLRPTARFSNLPEAGQLYEYQQAPTIQAGSEMYIDWHPWSNLHLSNASEIIINRNLNTQLPLPFSPPWSNLFNLSWETENWETSLSWRYTAAQNRVDRNESETPAYHLFNLEGGYQLKWQDHKLGFHFALRNVFNQFYLRHLSRYRILNLPEQGRNLVLGVSLSL